MLPKPTAYHLLVKIRTLPTKSVHGIILIDKAIARDQASQETGILVDVGCSAWKAIDDGTPWAKIGDVVHFARYEGKSIMIEKQEYRIMPDNAIIAVSEPTEEDKL